MSRPVIEAKDFEEEYRRKGAYHTSSEGFQKWFLEHNYAMLAQGVPPFGRVLDIGCGEGRMRDYLPATDYCGIDLSETATRLARERHPGARFETARMEEVAGIFGRDSFDAVVCSLSLQYVPPDKMRETIRDIRNVLRPGAPFVFSYINCAHRLHGRLVERVEQADRALEIVPVEGLVMYLGAAGLVIEKMEGTNLPLDFAAVPAPLRRLAFRGACLLGRRLPWRSYHVVLYARRPA